MGFFTKKDTPTVPPNKSKRRECWDARDKFFECLTKNNIDNSLDPNVKDQVESQCGSLRATFENRCVESWYKYFQEKRFSEIKKDKYIAQLEAQGAQPLPFKLSPKK